MKSGNERVVFRFASFELDAAGLELRKSGVRVSLSGKPFEALLEFVKSSGDVVTREQLRDRLWGDDTFVDFEDSLNHVIQRLREALDDDSKRPRFIETVPGIGYRFTAVVDQSLRAEAATESHRRARRFQWALVPAAILMVIAVWALWPPAERQEPTGTSRVRPSIAVLPFDNLSGRAEDAVFADGASEMLTTELAKISSLRVISRTSTMRYRNPSVSLPQIAKELGVTHIVEGSALYDGEKVRITAQLIDAALDEHVWTDEYEEPPDEILASQKRVARNIAAAIHVRITPDEEARLAATRPVRPEVFATYMKARDALDAGNLDAAVSLFEETIALDADYAPAHSWLADIYITMGYWLGRPNQLEDRARAAALRGLKLDETLAEPHVLLGRIRAHYDWKWEEADKHFVRAIELNPSHVQARLAYAQYLVVVGREDEAVPEAELALSMDPHSTSTMAGAAEVFHGVRLYDRAIDLLHAAATMVPDAASYHVQLSCIYGAKGDYVQSLEHIQRVTSYGSGDIRARAIAAWVHAKAGEQATALDFARRLETESKPDHTTHYQRAFVYTALGDVDRAFELLDQAVKDRWVFLGMALTMPPYDDLRTDPRYPELLRSMGLRELRERNAAL